MTGFPLRWENHVTAERRQIKGLGKAAVQKILGEHGITRVLAEEGGRTSRGGMRLMEAYLAEANALHAAGIWDVKKCIIIPTQLRIRPPGLRGPRYRKNRYPCHDGTRRGIGGRRFRAHRVY